MENLIFTFLGGVGELKMIQIELGLLKTAWGSLKVFWREIGARFLTNQQNFKPFVTLGDAGMFKMLRKGLRALEKS